MKKIISAALLSLVSLTAQAHFIWIEPGINEVQLYFGEYGENIRESTGGRLDAIGNPEISLLNSLNPLDLTYTRKNNYIEFKLAPDTSLTAQEVQMGVQDLTKYNLGVVKPMYFARFAISDNEGQSASVLDVQPVGNGKIRVNFHGKPLENVKVEIFAPNLWMQVFHTNADGEISITTPWPGVYVIHVAYVESVVGNFKSLDYTGIRYVSTLSFKK